MRNENGLIILRTKIFNCVDNFNFLPRSLDNNHEIIYMLVREKPWRLRRLHIIIWAYEIIGHTGAQIIMCNLREKFWIISLRKVIKTILRKVIKTIISDCVTCKKQKAKLESKVFLLPYNRVRDASIFEIVGIDFARLLYLWGRGKEWICIFTSFIEQYI